LDTREDALAEALSNVIPSTPQIDIRCSRNSMMLSAYIRLVPLTVVSICLCSGLAIAGTEGLRVQNHEGRFFQSGGPTAILDWGTYDSKLKPEPPMLVDVVALATGPVQTLALKRDGIVVAWGPARNGETTVPGNLGQVTRIAAGGWILARGHSVALRTDGTVMAWGNNSDGQTTVPAGLRDVVAIAAGGLHTVAALRDGKIVAWGSNSQRQRTPPAGMGRVVDVAAGFFHTVALTADGRVVAWGHNTYGQTNVPAGLKEVVAIAASGDHSLALKADGTVVAWGANGRGQLEVPSTLKDVVAIAVGQAQNLALKSNGKVVAWGDELLGRTLVPSGLHNVTAIASGGFHSVVFGRLGLEFEDTQLSRRAERTVSVSNGGPTILKDIRVTIEGRDADQFDLRSSIPAMIEPEGKASLTLQFDPIRTGPLSATLKVYSNDPGSPFVVPLSGNGTFEISATKVAVANSPFTYATLRLDRSTGLLLQKISFTNNTGVLLNGLKLILSRSRVACRSYSSSVGKVPGTFEVTYSNAIKPNETISFDLVVFRSEEAHSGVDESDDQG